MIAEARYSPLFSRKAATLESFWISLRYFSYYRIAVAALFLGSSLYYEGELNLGAHHLRLFRLVAVVYLLFGVVLHVVLKNLRDLFNLQLTLQVCIDVLAITLLMYASGGMRSGLGVMLFVSLTAAALVAPWRLTILYAAVASIALLIEQSFWVLVYDFPTANFVQPGLMSIGLFATSGITGVMAQRVRANEELARQRGRELANQMRVNQLVIEDMHDGVIVLDHSGRVVQHNPRAQQMIAEEHLRGADLAALLPALGESWRAWRAEGEHAGGATLDLDLHGRDVRLRMLDTGIDEDFALIFMEDVTRTREQAQQLKLAALGRLTASIAHEIRNPLSAISHATELLAEETGEDGRARLYRIIHDNARRMERLVADVLQLNRRDRASSERIQVTPWLLEFIEDFAINESVRPELFSVDVGRDAAVEFDREHLRQVMWNLLRNAVRHCRGQARSVRVGMRVLGHQVEFNVIDDGPGVDEAHQGQLFEPFFTTDSKGTGLGLYLARELCSANRAVLEYVDDMPGAHFRILCREAPAG